MDYSKAGEFGDGGYRQEKFQPEQIPMMGTSPPPPYNSQTAPQFQPQYNPQFQPQYNDPSAQGSFPNQNMMNQQQQQQPTVIYIQPAKMENPPNDYLGYSIFATLCCCLCIGAFAIMKAAACRSAIAANDRPKAEEASRSARNMSHIAVGIGCVLLVIYVVLKFVIVVIE